MIQNDTLGGLGFIEVITENNKGHSPEFWAEKCTAKICGISDTAEPHIRLQAEAFRLAIYNAILYYIKEAISSERCTMKNILIGQGHEDLAKILTEIK
jgi:hypothetical protein|tara:strand:- start:234 stop:527 length:294 start_codon:yes stop_codon:yes gene_type:complete